MEESQVVTSSSPNSTLKRWRSTPTAAPAPRPVPPPPTPPPPPALRNALPRYSLAPRSHACVRRPASPLGHDPVDVLRGALDVARLAVDAVLRVDLQPPLSLLLQVLVHTRRAEALLRPVEDGEVPRDRHRVILERQVGRLVALVVRAGERYRREKVEGNLAVRLWVLDGRELGGGPEPRMVGSAVRESEPLSASRDVVHDARVQEGAPHAQRRRVRGWTHVAHRVKLLVHP
mmetsp:Transcript_34241/g.109978  ORF Transcript_34241/g.109978 Transcript_34241/m.109978 type:complete len:232 (-) Transcript_34241:1251-1946(-)